jgi:hypothetical protein
VLTRAVPPFAQLDA